MLDWLRDIPIVGDVRGTGYFWAIELVRDQATKETFTDEECEWLLRGFLSAELFERGLICRADDRGDPVDPALAAADRGSGAVRGDPLRPAPGARGGGERLQPRLVGGAAGAAAARPHPRPRRPAARRRGGPRPARPLGPHLRAADPTPWLSGGELLLTTGLQLTDEARPARVRRAAADHELAGLGFGTGFEHATVPARAARGGGRARLPALRGPLRGAVHRGHREGVHAPGQRAVRGAAARALRPRAAGADRALRARAGGRGRGARRR